MVFSQIVVSLCNVSLSNVVLAIFLCNLANSLREKTGLFALLNTYIFHTDLLTAVFI